MNSRNIITGFLIPAALLVAVFVPVMQAGAFKCALGILTTETMDGNNPATGQPWRNGDTYRFAFHSSVKRTAEAADIEVYNAWAQGLADASSAYEIGTNEGVTWKVIGSTNEVDARDNTSTNPEVDAGCAIFLLDGQTIVANDNADLWDGEIQNIINITEQGTVWAHWPYTGTYPDGTKAPGHSASFSALGGGGQIHQGFAGATNQWVWRAWTGDPPSTELPMYALSDPITVLIADANLPSVNIDTPDMITWSGEPIGLDATVVNNDTRVPQGGLSYTWTSDPNIIDADPNSGSGPELTVTIIDADKEDAVVRIDKYVPTGGATEITLTLSVLLEGKTVAITDSITIDVYDNACQGALDLELATIDPGDFNADCSTNIADLYLLAGEWLTEYSIIVPTEKLN